MAAVKRNLICFLVLSCFMLVKCGIFKSNSLVSNCLDGEDFKEKESKNEGDSVNVQYKCGDRDEVAILTCGKGFRASSKRSNIGCEPTYAVLRKQSDPVAKFDANKQKIVFIWYCMDKKEPCINA